MLPAEPSRAAAREAAVELASVRAMLWTLPENQHHAFVLRHWSGLSQNEIAEVLETTPSAVESLLVRARATLVAEYAGASADCEDVRRRLVEAASLGDTQTEHVQTCGRCRTAQTRLKRTAELASALALVPGTHVAHTLAGLVPGFSAQAAIASTGVAGSAATAGTAAGGGITSTIGSATAMSTAAKAILGAKVAVALVATTAAVVITHPAVPDSIATAFFRHFGHPAATGHPARRATVAASNPTSDPRHAGKPTGTGKPIRTGKPTGTGKPTHTGKPTGTGKPTHTGKPTGTGKPTHTGKPTGTGKPTHTGKPTGTGKPTHTGKPTGTGKPTHTGKPTGTGKPTHTGKPTGTGKPTHTGKPT